MTILDKKYQTGVVQLDSQHAEIIKTLQKIIDSLHEVKKAKKAEFMRQVFDELKLYAHTHLDYEEKLIKKINYPEQEKHLALHQYFREKLIDLQKNADGNEDEVLRAAAQFIKEWFLNHISTEDKKLGDYCLFKKETGPLFAVDPKARKNYGQSRS